jgi:hypothetical protein
MEPANQVRMFLTGPDLDDQYAIQWLVKRETPPPEEEGAEEPAAGEEAGG